MKLGKRNCGTSPSSNNSKAALGMPVDISMQWRFCAASKECHRCSTVTTGKHWFIQVPLIRFALFHQVMCRYQGDPDLGGRQVVHLILDYKSLQWNNNYSESNCLIPNGISKNKSWFINIHLTFKIPLNYHYEISVIWEP